MVTTATTTTTTTTTRAELVWRLRLRRSLLSNRFAWLVDDYLLQQYSVLPIQQQQQQQQQRFPRNPEPRGGIAHVPQHSMLYRFQVADCARVRGGGGGEGGRDDELNRDHEGREEGFRFLFSAFVSRLPAPSRATVRKRIQSILLRRQYVLKPSLAGLCCTSRRRPFAVGCWLLAVGCWLLAVGCWLLAFSCTVHRRWMRRRKSETGAATQRPRPSPFACFPARGSAEPLNAMSAGNAVLPRRISIGTEGG